MQYCDVAIVGTGMGGALSALGVAEHKKVLLFEKDKNLGGCAGTFKRHGNFYNVGATTIVGYEQNHPLKNILDSKNISLDVTTSPVAFRVIHNKKVLDRHQNFEKFLYDLNQIYPHKNNRQFWQKIKKIDEAFWNLKKVYFAKYSIKRYFHTMLFALNVFKTFGFDLFKSADGFIKKSLPNISQEYQDFIDAGLLITVQSDSKNIPLLSMALGLAYPFHPVFYANGGMGKIFESLLRDFEVRVKEPITSIKKDKDGYILTSSKGTYSAKQVILNTTLFDSGKLFQDSHIKDFYKQYEASDQSAFVVYLSLCSTQKLQSHYQIILDEVIPNAFSKSFFVSIAHQEDKRLSKNGLRSITISTHTKASFWKSLSKKEYEDAKKQTQEYIIKEFLANFSTLKRDDIVHAFSATSKTFESYIARTNCGGTPIKFSNIHKIASCTTPFQGLFHTGDTVFAGQGWPGVALGAEVLARELNE